MNELGDFCEWVGEPGAIQEMINHALSQWRADTGRVVGVKVNRWEVVWEWRKGRFARCTQAVYRILHNARDDHALPFDFVTLACLPSDGGTMADGPVDYIIMRVDPTEEPKK